VTVRWRALLGLVLAGLVGAALAPAGGADAAASRPPVAFADGTWTLSYVADVQVSGPFPDGSQGSGRGVLTGTGVFDVTGGGVAGTHSAAGTAPSSVTVPGGLSGPAILNLTVKGPVAGTADRAVLQGDVHASGSVSIGNGGLTTTVPLDFGGALGDGAGAVLSTFSTSCDRTTGSWTVDLRGAGEAPSVGLSVAGPATFVAIRGGDSSGVTPAYARQISQLLADTDAFADRIGSAPLDTSALDTIVARSEALGASLPVVDECATPARSRTTAYASPLGVEVARLLSAARAQLTHVSTGDLAYLLALGYRTAAIGSGSTWSGAAPLERVLRTELDRRGSFAGATHDSATAALVTVARRQFGVVKPERAAASPPSRPVRGVATIELTTRTKGRGDRPTLSWSPVAGAADYRVVLLDATLRPYWSWQGTTSTVVVGATEKPMPPAASGPHVVKGSTWSVAALDGVGQPIALSTARAISP
jgi:hypothetical protein